MPDRKRNLVRQWWLALALAAAGLGLARPAAGQSAGGETRINLTLKLPAVYPSQGYRTEAAFPGVNFNQPIALAHYPGDPSRLLVAERPGMIALITRGASPVRTQFLDISARVGSTASERGLLALALHPLYPEKPYLFVYYTTETNGQAGSGLYDRLARFTAWPGDPTRMDPGSEAVLIEQFDQAGNHNGGDLHFGPDGYLYLSLGDEGGGNDTYNNSQKIDGDFFSGLLRLDVDELPGNLEPNPHPAVKGNYRVPADNPWVGATQFNGKAVEPGQVRTEFYAVGLRNPWRFSFDALSGDLWLADVGQGAREEVNRVRAGGNYGWKFREGFIATPGITGAPAGVVFDDPVFDYSRSLGSSVTGGVVYHGQALPALRGTYVFGDILSGNLWSLRPTGPATVEAALIGSQSGISGFGIDPANGDILLANLFGNTVLRLVAAVNEAAFPETLSATGAFADLATLQPQAGLRQYEINHPFWSDHAVKTRWFTVARGLEPAPSGFATTPWEEDPQTLMTYAEEGSWTFPRGMVWIKHFALPLTRGDPATARRLETRFLVKTEDGAYGVTYRWNEAQTEAFLVPAEGATETLTINDGGTLRPQTWRYPSRGECLTCHRPEAGFALGFNTRQLNRPGPEEAGAQILAWANRGSFSNPPEAVDVDRVLVPLDHPTASLEFKVRSWLQANCAGCHRPGGGVPVAFDARIATPLERAGILEAAPVAAGPANPALRLIAAGSRENSDLYQRVAALGPRHMPPLATGELHAEAIEVLGAWIDLLPAGEIWPGEFGFKALDWFGVFHDSGEPWIWHLDHGWLYAEGPSQESIFLYDLKLQSWVWTSREVYPWLYYYRSTVRERPGAPGWLWFAPGPSDGERRWFWEAGSQSWLELPLNREP